MARHAIPSPEVTEAARLAADAVRRLQEQTAQRAAQVLADRIKRESTAAIAKADSRALELRMEMKRLTESKPPKDEPETVTCHIEPAAAAAAALTQGQQDLQAQKAAHAALPPVPPAPGRVLTLLARVPLVGLLAQGPLNSRQRARRLARAAIVRADHAIATATAELETLRSQDAEAAALLADARQLWENTLKQGKAFWLNRHAAELGGCEDTANLLRWRPDYVLRPAAEFTAALASKPWQDSEGDGGGDGAPPPVGVRP